MKKLFVLALLLLPFIAHSQYVGFCGSFASHAPISLNGITGQTIRGDSINGNGNTTAISLINCSNIHITRSKFINCGQAVAIYLYNCANITIDSCMFDHVGAGIYALNCPLGYIVIQHNYGKNAVRSFAPTVQHGQFVQLNAVHGPGNRIRFNRWEDFDGQSDPEDGISSFQSGGTLADPLIISNNFIRRHIPISRTGSGMMLGDSGGSYINAFADTVISPGNVGIGIAGGTFINATNNVIYSPPHPGSTVSNAGLVFNNFTPTINPCNNNTMSGNIQNWYSDRFAGPNDYYAPGSCTTFGTNTYGATISPSLLTIQLSPSCTVQAPVISYTPTSNIYQAGTAITTWVPVNIGGTPTSYTITPALPSGLSFSLSTGAITGTPTATSTSTAYTVTATNSGGNGLAHINITVNAPTISYAGAPFTFYQNTSAGTSSPTVTGTPSSYGISIALPTGLSFNTTNGQIIGTPTGVSANTAYTVTANYSGGVTAPTTFNVTVSGISYSGSPYTFYNGTAITPLSPIVTGATPTSYTTSPTLPTGLSINSSGVISGTPTVTSVATPYTVTAHYSGGQATSFAINITVSGISYAGAPFNFTAGTAITPANISTTGATPTNYSGSLPTGLVLNTVNGQITGTPTTAAGATPYTITASYAGGQTTLTTFNITVNAAPIAPPSITYTTPQTYTYGTDIGTLSPTNTGGVITSWAISPALPSGLNFNLSTGIITGIPTSTSTSTNYVITASNTSGSSPFIVNITVNKAALIVVADNKVKFLNTVNPPLTITYTGFVNGDNASNLTVQPVLTTSCTTLSPVGVYAITYATLATSSNYTFTYSDGMLSVQLPGTTIHYTRCVCIVP